MARKDAIELERIVVELLPGAAFRSMFRGHRVLGDI
jgi:translation initiation factor IF-1